MVQRSLENYWHPIARCGEVSDQPRRFHLLGTELVAFRDDDGVAVFKDVCIHRGSALSLGSVIDGRLRCAYHGWEYDRAGTCVKIPSLPPGSSVPNKARRSPIGSRSGTISSGSRSESLSPRSLSGREESSELTATTRIFPR